jgi:pyruvate dehydrogenase E2 component (dihydrolipoyllysine-residue acetyltransferase)
MAIPIIMPKFGQMTEESIIIEWLKEEGDWVAKGDTLFTVETDKSVMEVESFQEGTLLKIVVKSGISVPVQSTVGFLGKLGEVVPETATSAQPAAKAAGAPAATDPLPTPAALAFTVPKATRVQPALFRISPRANALARDCVIDPTRINGSGPGGRIVEKDVKAYLDTAGYHQLRVSPAAKRLAASENVDLLSVHGAGVSGRIDVADVERALAERPRPMNKIRQITGQRLAQSAATSPHFYVTVEVDMTELIKFRARLKNLGKQYSVTDFISHAVVLTLKEFPDVNGSTDGMTIRWNSHVHLGLAVSLDQGLVVPVIRNADELTIAELTPRSQDLIGKARAGKLTPDEMTGSTFTISNMGMLDVENFTAIINPGEAAILAVSSTLKRPVARGDEVVVRSIMKMTLSSDHRLIDGAMAARFINAVKRKLEDVEMWTALMP